MHPFLNTIIAMTYDFLPFMILPLYTTLLQLDENLLEAARDLGAGPAADFLQGDDSAVYAGDCQRSDNDFSSGYDQLCDFGYGV